jgi:Holliday junction DNA helicase RuvA
VREDAQLLYGLPPRPSAAFRELIKISGVGRARRCRALGHERGRSGPGRDAQEAGRLVKVPGIGKKTAERLLLELKGKLGPTWALPAPASDAQADILQALLALGYSDKEAAAALKACRPMWA